MALLILGLVVLCMTVFFVPSYQLDNSKNESFLSGYVSILKSKYMMLMYSYYLSIVGLVVFFY